MRPSSVYVWDPLVRVVHWSVAALVVIELFNEAGANPWHRYLGYAAGALVAMRLAWGIFGSSHARLSAIAGSARDALDYVRRPRGTRRIHYLGHTPLGACMALALWAVVLFIVATGWLLQVERFWGDETVEALHAYSSYLLGGCAVIHVGGVAFTSARARVNLVKAMITGRKTFSRSAQSNNSKRDVSQT